MKTTTVFAALALSLVAATAGAQEMTPDNWTGGAASVTSTKTRAQVRDELAQARARGEVTVADSYRTMDTLPRGEKTREQVRAELAQARANGTLIVGSEYGVQQAFTSTRTRAEVKSEVLNAQARGERLSTGE